MTPQQMTIEHMDAVTLVINDHRIVEMLFAAYEQATEAEEKLRLVGKIIEELSVHAAVEEQVLYPVVAERLPDGEEEAEHAETEHAEVKEILAQLERTRVDDPSFDTQVRSLISDVRHHVEEEESDMLPKLRDALGTEELLDLGARLRMAKASAPISPSMETAALIDLTKDELYAKAQELDIEGRSDMTKDELARAISNAE
jgi:hemerythrin superfamily protein